MRLLVGTRPEPRFAHLLELAQANGGLTDLDQASADDLHEALLEYASDLLANTDYASLGAHATGEALAEAIAARLTGVNDPATSRTLSARWAGANSWSPASTSATSSACRSSTIRGEPESWDWRFPLGLPELLELDLAGRGARPWLRPVLAALAHGEGLGMPERVIAHIAPGFRAAGQASGGPMPPQELRNALADARFYLRRDIEEVGTRGMWPTLTCCGTPPSTPGKRAEWMSCCKIPSSSSTGNPKK